VTSPSLVRLSQLARFWELHPRTIRAWVQQGRLVAIRSPGNHFRLRVSDVRAFCEREGMAVPPFVAARTKRAVIAASDPVARSVGRALKGDVALETFPDPYAAVVAAATRPADVLALGAAFPRFDAAAATRALRRDPATAAIAIVAFDVTSRAQVAALEAAGVSRTLARASEEDLPRALRQMLGLEAE